MPVYNIINDASENINPSNELFEKLIDSLKISNKLQIDKIQKIDEPKK